MAGTLGTLNPLRYRGYVYDTETGLYYLQSRYYDPEICRFINADNQLSTGNSIAGTNIYAYCGNNPITRIDPTGHSWLHWAIAITVVVACAVAVAVTAGGAAPAVMAVSAVASGLSAPIGGAATTVAAAAFIGSATYLGVSAMSALENSTSLSDFGSQANWGTVAGTAGSAAFYGGCAYVGTKSSASSPKSGSEKSTSPISNSDAKRIQNAANRTNQTITVVGSRASGTAGPNSDWDYIMSGNSAQRHSAASSIPRGAWGGENNSGIDIFSSYSGSPNPVVLDRSRPYIVFFPE